MYANYVSVVRWAGTKINVPFIKTPSIHLTVWEPGVLVAQFNEEEIALIFVLPTPFFYHRENCSLIWIGKCKTNIAISATGEAVYSIWLFRVDSTILFFLKSFLGIYTPNSGGLKGKENALETVLSSQCIF